MSEVKSLQDFIDFDFDLPEESDDAFRKIEEKDYIPAYEEEIRRYMMKGISGELPHNDILYTHVDVPRDLTKLEFQKWAIEEIRRCREGHNGLCGKMYFYFNYCYIETPEKKKRPDFRVVDNDWFKLVEACQRSKEWGIICVKRRRVGASWKEAADMLHDCLFNTTFHIGMNSKTERDSLSLFKKIKFIYESLPPFLRVPTTKSNTKAFLDFSYMVKDSQGNKITKGNQSSIQAVAPTDNAYEGMMLSKLVIDEAGKIKNLSTIWQYSEDCLMQETRRVGMPIIFGTAGDIGAEGKDLEYMWKNKAIYKLKPFFFSGWMGLTSDELGNDNKEEGIRWIVYTRHLKEQLRIEELNIFIQKYPLTIPEAFTVTSSAGVGNIIKIKSQMQSLVENPAKQVNGWFRMGKGTDTVTWVPDPKGKCIIYEQPKPGVESLYIGGCDPADHNETFKDVSDLSMYLMRRNQGTDPARIVFEYSDRPSDVTEFYEQAMMACIYYNKAKLLIERNRYMMINFFDNSNYKYLLARTPAGVMKVNGGRMNTYGVQMTPATKKYLTELLAKYIEDYYTFIPSRALLDDFCYFGARNTDRAMAFGINLLYMEDYGYDVTNAVPDKSILPNFGYKNIGGKITRVRYGQQPISNTILKAAR